MIRDITLGQFYPGNSWVHKLDPRVKIIATLLFLIELFIVNDFLGFAIAAVVLGVIVYRARPETDFDFTFVHLRAEHLYDQWGSSLELGFPAYYQRRHSYGDFYGGAPDPFDHRFLHADTLHQTAEPDGRN